MPDRPTLDEQARFYDDWNVRHRSAGYDEIDDEIRLRADRVLGSVGNLGRTDLAILEVGCGTGWFAEKLCNYGKVTGIDLSQGAIEVAEKRGSSARFIAGDFMAYEFERESFDVIVCLETLFYVEEQQAFVERLYDLARPGAILYLTNINKFVYDRRSDIPPPEKGQIRHWLSIGQTKKLLANRFEVTSASTLEPRGDRGILRFVNSHKLNAVASGLLSAQRVRWIKERLGLGGGVVIEAQRR